jgi:predicted MPP superfamily phosphohydrolase
MKLKLFIMVLLSLSFMSCTSPHINFVEPYLLNVTPTSIQIHWEIEAGQSVVKYGKSKTLEYEIITPGKSRKQHVELKDLDPDTPYYYQVEIGNHVFGIHSFRTAPGSEKAFTFSVYGDNRIKDTSFNYPHPHGQIIAGVQRDHPAFLISTGDIFKTGVDTVLYMEDFFLGAKDLIANTPIFLAIGNHEYGGDPAATATKKYFAFPDNRTWYQMKYGKVQFLFLDSTKLLYKWEGTERIKKSNDEIADDEQLRWLENKLMEPKPQWRIVALHHHIFSSGIFGIDHSLVEHLVPLLEKYDVDLVLGGHEHNYERSEKKGITYILTGGGGSYLRPVNVNNNPYQKSAVAEFHHVRVKVERDRLIVSTICDVDRKKIPDYSPKHKLEPPGFAVGDVIDEFEILNTN